MSTKKASQKANSFAVASAMSLTEPPRVSRARPSTCPCRAAARSVRATAAVLPTRRRPRCARAAVPARACAARSRTRRWIPVPR
jgi:hypothetical protein